jgi:hypothetical protein
MGDDQVQWGLRKGASTPEQFIAFAKEKYGITLTIESDLTRVRFADQNFCSMNWKLLEIGVYVPVPINWDKVSWNLMNCPKTKTQFIPDVLHSFCQNYCFHENAQMLVNLLRVIAPVKSKSLAWFRNKVTGLE